MAQDGSDLKVFLVKVSGTMTIEATSKEQAERLASRSPAVGACCGFHAQEVGKDVDALGWPLQQKQEGASSDATSLDYNIYTSRHASED